MSQSEKAAFLKTLRNPIIQRGMVAQCPSVNQMRYTRFLNICASSLFIGAVLGIYVVNVAAI